MKRFLAKTPLFFRKVRNTAITVLTVCGLVATVSKDPVVKEICTGVALAGASVGITAQSTKENE